MRCLYCKTNLFTLFNYFRINKLFLCKNCFRKTIIWDKEIVIKNEPVHIIYGYNKILKKMIIDLKVNYQFDISQKVLGPFIKTLQKKYQSYWIIAAPSYYLSDHARGFNHTKAIFSVLKLPFLDLAYKNKRYKQSQQLLKQRDDISFIININNGFKIKNKNILIVDDVMTTGATLFTIKQQVQQYHPKKVKLLVLCKKII